MEDKFMMMDVLLNEKCLVESTTTALNEASCEDIYKAYSNILGKISKEQKEVFEICYNKGWYQLEEAQKTKITKEIDKLSKELG